MEAEQPESPSGCHSVAYQYRRRVRVSRKLICFRKFSKFIFHIASECCARGKPFLNKQEFELISLELMISEETTTTTTTTRTSASTRRQRNGEDGSPPRLPRPGPRPGLFERRGERASVRKHWRKKNHPTSSTSTGLAGRQGRYRKRESSLGCAVERIPGRLSIPKQTAPCDDDDDDKDNETTRALPTRTV